MRPVWIATLAGGWLACAGAHGRPPAAEPADRPAEGRALETRAPPETVQSFGPLGGAAGETSSPETRTAAPATLDAPAWGGARIAAANAPTVAVQAWSRAPNRDRCALLVPATLAAGEGARPRAARERGGWRVSWDQPGRRDVFGIAGTAAEVAASEAPGLVLHREWSDGSRAVYGRQATEGDLYVAQLQVEGQGCVYQLWSHLGRDHLEHLLEHLQRVENAQ
jgi:hypothetical protein